MERGEGERDIGRGGKNIDNTGGEERTRGKSKKTVKGRKSKRGGGSDKRGRGKGREGRGTKQMKEDFGDMNKGNTALFASRKMKEKKYVCKYTQEFSGS